MLWLKRDTAIDVSSPPLPYTNWCPILVGIFPDKVLAVTENVDIVVLSIESCEMNDSTFASKNLSLGLESESISYSLISLPSWSKTLNLICSSLGDNIGYNIMKEM